MCAMSAIELEKVHPFCKVYAFHFCVTIFSTSLGIISMSFAYAVYSWGLNGITSGIIGVIVTGVLLFIIPYWANDLFVQQSNWIEEYGGIHNIEKVNEIKAVIKSCNTDEQHKNVTKVYPQDS